MYIKSYEYVQCALWAHKNRDDEDEAFWMEKALEAYRTERDQIVDVHTLTIWDIGELMDVDDILAGYYGDEAVA